MQGRDRFHYPAGKGPYFGRALSSACTDATLWTAVQMEEGGRNTVLLCRQNAEERSLLALSPEGFCHQPCLAPAGGGRVVVAWNETHGDAWFIKCASVDGKSSEFERVETVYSSGRLCLPPTVTVLEGQTWVCWPCLEEDAIRIRLARKGDGGWEQFESPSPAGVNAFRPSLAANREGLLLAWDQYEGGTYKVVLAHFDGSRSHFLGTIGQEGERSFCPKLVACPHGGAYATWLVVQDVADSLGIVDHFAFAQVAHVASGQVEYVLDGANPVDARIVADLREGLLASDARPYKGYNGLRRNPHLALSDRGDLWCLWEVRFEEEPTSTSGHLVGRKLEDGGGWGPASVLHSGGYCYCVPSRFSGDRMPLAFLKFEEEGTDIVAGDFVKLDRGEPYEIEHSRWQRWVRVRIEPDRKVRKKVRVGNGEYGLFWADTHCHSVFSPDAEGEADELIHFARDVAALDAVCVIDNDFYPHKALTEAEWQVQQELSAHFTREGEFVVFAGWEYTYHRDDLEPDFNHRCILYPRGGWPILRRIDPDARTDREMLRALKRTPALCCPHHCTYRIVDPELDVNVEVCSSWRVCIEETDFTLKQLQSGQRFGFMGASDSHRAVPGLGGALTGVFAEGLTPEKLFEAYRNRRTIATQGHRVFADFRAADAFIGGEGRVSGAPEFEAHLEAPEPIEFVELIRDGRCIHRLEPHGRKCDFGFTDRESRPGEHFYFLRVKLIGAPSFNEDPAKNAHGPFTTAGRYGHNLARARGPFAWTSPIWLTIR